MFPLNLSVLQDTASIQEKKKDFFIAQVWGNLGKTEMKCGLFRISDRCFHKMHAAFSTSLTNVHFLPPRNTYSSLRSISATLNTISESGVPAATSLACSAMKRPKSPGFSPILLRVSQSCKCSFFFFNQQETSSSQSPTHPNWSLPCAHPAPSSHKSSIFVGFPFVFANCHAASVPACPLPPPLPGTLRRMVCDIQDCWTLQPAPSSAQWFAWGEEGGI